MTALPLALFLILLAVGAPGRGRALLSLRDASRAAGLRLIGITILLCAVLVLLARRYIDVTQYAETVVIGTMGLLGLYILAERLDRLSGRTVEWLDARKPWQVATAAAVLSAAVHVVVLDGMPHVSDEVAYLFQAKAMAAGRLSQPAPDPAGSFTFVHTMIENGRWFGIMNPGWPLFLAIGELVRAPWIVNPVVGAVALLLFHGFLTEAGVTGRTARLTLLLLAVSPFLLFMNATFMSHPINLALFSGFCWSWARLLRTESRRDALFAGLCLGLNLLVRPTDTVAVSIPFAVQGLLRLRRAPRLLPRYVLVVGVALAGLVGTLGYNRALTGHATLMPMTRYFEQRNPGERFGMGFGADMGTKIHGDEWPGFYPDDAVRVSAYRTSQLLLDLFGLPLIPLAALVLAAQRRRDWDEWLIVILGSAVALVAMYFFHFYHGIAYGSRHLYLAAPALALLLARPAADWLERGASETTRRGRALTTALFLYTALFAYPPLIREYGQRYRGSDGRVREAVRVAGLRDAVVFVSASGWGWKSAFPLNDYPLARNTVIFARDSAPLNQRVMEHFRERRFHKLQIQGDGRVTLTPLPQPQ